MTSSKSVVRLLRVQEEGDAGDVRLVGTMDRAEGDLRRGNRPALPLQMHHREACTEEEGAS